MGIVLANALLVDIDPPRVEAGTLRVEGGRIVARAAQGMAGQSDTRCDLAKVGDEVVDCSGAVVLPGLVNGHTHLYSALAVGMPAPPKSPRNFLEILKFVWWRLDQALDAESIELSARIGALQALRCGTTTLIDHHASPNCIAGSLDLVERGLSAVGVRGVLCYETTDRHGRTGREAGIVENRRYLAKCGPVGNRRFAGMVGAHASFTLEDESLASLTKLAEEFETGVHIHVAEDLCDEEDARSRGVGLVDRLDRFGLLRPDTVFAHGTHLSAKDVERVNKADLTMAHNPRSNMNNAVGYAPVAAFECPLMLGTDGIGADMFAEAQSAWMISRHAREQTFASEPRAAARADMALSNQPARSLSPVDILSMLANSARRASRALGVMLGRLEVGAVADLVVTDHAPFTVMTDENVAGYFLFGLSSNYVRSVMVDGQWRMRDRIVVGRDEAADRREAQVAAQGAMGADGTDSVLTYVSEYSEPRP